MPIAIARLAERSLTTKFGVWQEVLYYDGTAESMALIYGDVARQEAVACRVHSACTSAHVFNSIECDCREQMAISQAIIQDRGCGVVIWLDQDGRGNGHLALMLVARLAAEQAIPQTQAYLRLGYRDDRRRYEQAAAILHDLGVSSVQLLTNSPGKAGALAEGGVAIVGLLPVAVDLARYPQLREYYEDKVTQGHTFDSSHGS